MRKALIALLALLPLGAAAVRPGQPSGTAEVVCSYRGIAAQHPDPKSAQSRRPCREAVQPARPVPA
jgi:hypothetical protein